LTSRIDCPVDASLEHQLFDDWTQSFNDGDFEIAAELDSWEDHGNTDVVVDAELTVSLRTVRFTRIVTVCCLSS
jgi:hypothetical protein